MFGLGFWEIAIVLAVVLVVLGPKNLPSFAKSMGKALREFRSATNDLRRAVESETTDDGPYRNQPSTAGSDDDGDEDKPPEGDEPPDDYGSAPALPETTEEVQETRTKTPDAALVTAKLGDEKVKEAMRSRLRMARKSGSRTSAALGKIDLQRSKTPKPADAEVEGEEKRSATQPVTADQVEAVVAAADAALEVTDGQIEEETERTTPPPEASPSEEAEAAPASDQAEPEEAKPAAKGKKKADAKGKKKAAAKKKPARAKATEPEAEADAKPKTKAKPKAAAKKAEDASSKAKTKTAPKKRAKTASKAKTDSTAKAKSDSKAKAKTDSTAKAKSDSKAKAKQPAKKSAKKAAKKSSKKDDAGA